MHKLSKEMHWLILKDAGQLVLAFSANWSGKIAKIWSVNLEFRLQSVVWGNQETSLFSTHSETNRTILTVLLLRCVTFSLLKGFYSVKIYCTCARPVSSAQADHIVGEKKKKRQVHCYLRKNYLKLRRLT